MTNKYVILLALVALTASLGYAYADQLKYDFSPEFLVGQSSSVEVLSNNTVKVHIISEYYYPSSLQVPEEEFVSVVETDGGFFVTVLDVLEEWNLIYEVVVDEPEPEPVLSPEQQAGIDEKIAELEQIYEDAVTCKAYGTEGNSMFQSYLEEKISKDKEEFTELPVNVREAKLIKAREACRVFFEVAVHISDDPAMLEKFKAQQQAEIEEAARLAELEVDTDYTDPVTTEDIIDEQVDAQKTLAEYPTFYKNPYGECEPTEENPLRCENRGGPTEGAECGPKPGVSGESLCPQKAFQASLTYAVSEEANYDVIQKLVCDAYLNQYTALVERIRAGDVTAELPAWLAHCDISEPVEE